MVRTCLSVMRRFRSSTFFTLATSKKFNTGVFRLALKSPRVMARPKITDVTVLLTDCMVCMSVP